MNSVKRITKATVASGVSIAIASTSVLASSVPTFHKTNGNPIDSSVVQTIQMNETNFDPMKGIKAKGLNSSGQEVDLTNRITYTVATQKFIDGNGNFNFQTHGEMVIVYKVIDDNGNQSELTVTHIVEGPEPSFEVSSSKKLTFSLNSNIKKQEILSGIRIDNGFGVDITDTATVSSIDTSTSGEKEVTVTVTNEYGKTKTLNLTYIIAGTPKIELLSGKPVTLGSTFNPLDRVKGSDSFGNTANSLVRLKPGSDTVNTNRAGNYRIIYLLEDDYGETELEVVFTVVEPSMSAPTIKEESKVFIEKGKNVSGIDLREGLIALDGNSEDISQEIQVVSSNIPTSNGTYHKGGVYPVTYSVTDQFGQTTTFSRDIVILEENDSAFLVTKHDYTLEMGFAFDIFDFVSVEDSFGNSNENVTYEIIESNVDTNHPGTYRVSVMFVDELGNFTVVSFDVKVKDTEAPTITQKDGVSLEVDYGSKFNYKDFFDVSDNANLPEDITVKILQNIDTSKEGYQDFVVEVSDPEGNTAKYTFEFYVKEAPPKPPVIDVKDITTEVGSELNPKEHAGQYGEDDTVVVDVGNFDGNKLGEYTISVTVTNKHNLTSTKTFKITVVDTTKPVVKLKGNAKTTFDLNEKVNVKELLTLSDNYYATDALDFKVIQNVDTSKAGVQTVIVEVTDPSGNKTTFELEVTVKEAPKTKPTITAKDREVFAKTKFDPMLGVSAKGEDGEDLTSLISIENSNVNMSKPGVYEVTYVVKDTNGGVARKTIKITVLDGTAPIISANNIHVAKGKAFDYMLGLSGAEDNIDGNITNKVTVSGSVNVDVPGEYKLTYSVTDSSGNRASKTITVFVHDVDVDTEDGSPVLIVENKDVIQSNKFNPLAGVVALDGVDGDITSKITVSGEVNTDKPGKYTLTYSVTNSEGKTTTKDVVVTVRSKDEADVESSPDADYEKVQTFDQTPVMSIAAPGVLMSIAGLLGLKKKKED